MENRSDTGQALMAHAESDHYSFDAREDQGSLALSRVALHKICDQVFPRILTQICRDPISPHHGCCDRNWWHYKIRDFPSIILQQAAHTIALAASMGKDPATAHSLRELASAAGRFWNARALRYGAFEEYYPFEQGYPPLAFSTLAVAHLCTGGVLPLLDVRPGLDKAVRQLLTRFEAEAANQQVAGTAALAMISRLAPELVPQAEFGALLERTLALQTREGWFPEYDGPDLGYLSVTMDCLWDLYDATGDDRVYSAIERAFEFLAWFVIDAAGSAGMHNARNTDYIVPYGIARLSLQGGLTARRAAAVLARLYQPLSACRCPLEAVDDRYWCHYIGTSVFRAVITLDDAFDPSDASLPSPDQLAPKVFAESGQVWQPPAAPLSPGILVSTRKGSVLTAFWPGGQRASDFGWIVMSHGKTHVSHWWTPQWQVRLGPSELGCDGWLVPVREHTSSPWKHVILRAASFMLGARVIPLLKRVLIFRRASRAYTFRRRITKQEDRVVVEDSITGIRPGDEVRRAPRSSKRHVASADSYHPEDLSLLQRTQKSEVIEYAPPHWRAVTTYWSDGLGPVGDGKDTRLP